MLTPLAGERSRIDGRSPRSEARLWHDAVRHMPSLGCVQCPEKNICGGLRVAGALYSCLDNCCGKPESCDRVCRKSPDYAARVREVDTFRLATTPRTPVLLAPSLPVTVPILFHASNLERAFGGSVVCLPLYELIDRREGRLRFTTRSRLCESFGLEQRTRIVLTGTDRDPPLERWWELGTTRRRTIIRGLRKLGIELVATPNYSLFVDRPRWDDLHAMKRIALVHAEFQQEGLPAALHVNGRTDRDFERWAEFVAARPEISHIAYEFGTGTGRNGRRERHAAWLCDLASGTGRPLDLVMRGGLQVLPGLAGTFRRVTVFESSAFMKTMKRQRASWEGGCSRVTWRPAPTPEGAPLDDLFADNLAVIDAALKELVAPAAPYAGRNDTIRAAAAG